MAVADDLRGSVDGTSPMWRFGGGNKAEKGTIVGKLVKFFNKYFGISNVVNYEFIGQERSYMAKVAEEDKIYQ